MPKDEYLDYLSSMIDPTLKLDPSTGEVQENEDQEIEAQESNVQENQNKNSIDINEDYIGFLENTDKSLLAPAGSLGESTPVDIDFSKYEQYFPETGVLMGDMKALNRARGSNQPGSEQFLNMASQLFLGEIVGGTVETFGYFQKADLALKSLKDEEFKMEDFDGSLATAGRGIKSGIRENFPIYQREEGTWNPSDPGWWANGLVSTGSTVALLLPSMLAVKGVGLLGRGFRMMTKSKQLKFLSNQVKAGNMSLETANAYAKLVRVGKNIPGTIGATASATANVLGQATFSRHAESMMEGEQVAQSEYARLMNLGIFTEEEAKRLAAKAAADVYKKNWGLILQDIFQYGVLAATRGKGVFGQSKLAKPGTVLATMASEGLIEEGYQHIISEEAKYMNNVEAGLVEKPTSFDDRFSEYLNDGNFWTAVSFGAIGAGVFQVVGMAAGKVKDHYKDKYGFYKDVEGLGNVQETVEQPHEPINVEEQEAEVVGKKEVFTYSARTAALVKSIEAAAQGGIDINNLKHLLHRVGSNLSLGNLNNIKDLKGSLSVAVAELEEAQEAALNEDDVETANELNNKIKSFKEVASVVDSFEETYKEQSELRNPEIAKHTTPLVLENKLLDSLIRETVDFVQKNKMEIPRWDQLSSAGTRALDDTLRLKALETYSEKILPELINNENISPERRKYYQERLEKVNKEIAELKESLAKDGEVGKALTSEDKKILKGAKEVSDKVNKKYAGRFLKEDIIAKNQDDLNKWSQDPDATVEKANDNVNAATEEAKEQKKTADNAANEAAETASTLDSITIEDDPFKDTEFSGSPTEKVDETETEESEDTEQEEEVETKETVKERYSDKQVPIKKVTFTIDSYGDGTEVQTYEAVVMLDGTMKVVEILEDGTRMPTSIFGKRSLDQIKEIYEKAGDVVTVTKEEGYESVMNPKMWNRLSDRQKQAVKDSQVEEVAETETEESEDTEFDKHFKTKKNKPVSKYVVDKDGNRDQKNIHKPTKEQWESNPESYPLVDKNGKEYTAKSYEEVEKWFKKEFMTKEALVNQYLKDYKKDPKKALENFVVAMNNKFGYGLVEMTGIKAFVKARAEGNTNISIEEFFKGPETEEESTSTEDQKKELKKETEELLDERNKIQEEIDDLEDTEEVEQDGEIGKALEAIGVQKFDFSGKVSEWYTQALNEDFKKVLNEARSRTSNNPWVKIRSLNAAYANRLRAELYLKGLPTDEMQLLKDVLEVFEEETVEEKSPTQTVESLEEERDEKLKPLENKKEEIEEQIEEFEKLKEGEVTEAQSTDIEAKKADIEKRRKKELNEKASDIVEKVEDYEATNEEGETTYIQVRTMVDGSQLMVWGDEKNRYGNTTQLKDKLNKGYDFNKNPEAYFDQASFGAVNKVGERTAEEANLAGLKNKINAKYDAELTALEQSTTTEETPVEEVIKEDPKETQKAVDKIIRKEIKGLSKAERAALKKEKHEKESMISFLRNAIAGTQIVKSETLKKVVDRILKAIRKAALILITASTLVGGKYAASMPAVNQVISDNISNDIANIAAMPMSDIVELVPVVVQKVTGTGTYAEVESTLNIEFNDVQKALNDVQTDLVENDLVEDELIGPEVESTLTDTIQTAEPFIKDGIVLGSTVHTFGNLERKAYVADIAQGKIKVELGFNTRAPHLAKKNKNIPNSKGIMGSTHAHFMPANKVNYKKYPIAITWNKSSKEITVKQSSEVLSTDMVLPFSNSTFTAVEDMDITRNGNGFDITVAKDNTNGTAIIAKKGKGSFHIGIGNSSIKTGSKINSASVKDYRSLRGGMVIIASEDAQVSVIVSGSPNDIFKTLASLQDKYGDKKFYMFRGDTGTYSTSGFTNTGSTTKEDLKKYSSQNTWGTTQYLILLEDEQTEEKAPIDPISASIISMLAGFRRKRKNGDPITEEDIKDIDGALDTLRSALQEVNDKISEIKEHYSTLINNLESEKAAVEEPVKKSIKETVKEKVGKLFTAVNTSSNNLESIETPLNIDETFDEKGKIQEEPTAAYFASLDEEGFHKDKPNTIAWKSAGNIWSDQLDKEKNKEMSIYLENPDNNLRDHSLKIEVDLNFMENRPTLTKNVGKLKVSINNERIVSQLKAGERVADVGYMAVKATLMREGQEVLDIEGNPLVVYLHDHTFEYWAEKNREDLIRETLALKQSVADEYQKGNTVLTAKIIDKNDGKMNTDRDAENKFILHNLQTTLEIPTNKMEFSMGGISKEYLQADGNLDPALPRKSATPGGIYTKVRTAANNIFPLRLFADNINENEAELIRLVYKELLNDASKFKKIISDDLKTFIKKSQDPRINQIPSVKKLTTLTNKDLLNFLVFEGTRTAGKKESALYVNSKGLLRVGDKVFTRETIDTQSFDFKNRVMQRKRRVLGPELNNNAYKKYIVENDLVRSNAISPYNNGLLFVQPVIEFGPISAMAKESGQEDNRSKLSKFNTELNDKIKDILAKLYPEIGLEYTNDPIQPKDGTHSQRNIRNEQKAANKIFLDEIYQKKLSASDIQILDNKIKKLSDRIGDVTWHVRLSSKGTYYIAGYKNAPVTMDTYYTPYARGVHYQMAEDAVNFRLKVVDKLLKMSQPKETKRTRKYGEVAQPERLTIRSNKRKNVAKELQKKGVNKQQIEFVFSYMQRNNIKEISTEDLAIAIMKDYGFTVQVKKATKRMEGEVPVEYEEGTGVFYSESTGRQYTYTDELGWISSIPGKRGQESQQILEDVEAIDRYEKFSLPEDAVEEMTTNVRYEESWEYVSSDTYSRLTVPGGVNYTENEIRTPDIVPNIKGHASFSTPNGIGWFRSDDKVSGRFTDDHIVDPKDELYSVNDYDYYRSLDEKGELVGEKLEEYKALVEADKLAKEPTNTRRILEVQSDLFQKGRENKYLVSPDYEKGEQSRITSENIESEIQYEIKEKDSKYEASAFIEFYEPEIGGKMSEVYEDTRKAFDSLKEAEYYIEELKVKHTKRLERFGNQFLQLLNKDNKWISFFVDSIIQDSAKKGYERVLFPLGNTASKIEGHETLEEFIRNKEARISELEKDSEAKFVVGQKNNFDGTSTIIGRFKTEEEAEEHANTINESLEDENLDKARIYPYTSEDHSDEIKQLKKEVKDAKEQGAGAFSGIYNFYEETIPNILKKKGYKPKKITDEHGNSWMKVEIDPVRELKEILLQNTGGKIIGQADIDALTILIDAINQRQDTLPHEYAHFYIAWFKGHPIVQAAIEKFGSEEALVQFIGEQAVKQEGKAWEWWTKFVNWILEKLNKEGALEALSKEQLGKILTDAFLTRQDLSEAINEDDNAFKDVFEGTEFEGSAVDMSSKNGDVVIKSTSAKDKVDPVAKNYIDAINMDLFSDQITLTDENFKLMKPEDC